MGRGRSTYLRSTRARDHRARAEAPLSYPMPHVLAQARCHRCARARHSQITVGGVGDRVAYTRRPRAARYE
jgi:hypothetical protein